MNLSEKVQYLSGLMDGLGIDDSTDTGKVLLAMKDILDEVCEAVDGIDSDVDDIVDFCNAIDEDLHGVEEAVFCDDHDEPPHHHPHPHGEPHGPHGEPPCGHHGSHGPHGPHEPHEPHDHDHCCHHHPVEDDPLPFDDDDDWGFDEIDDLLPPLWKDKKDEELPPDDVIPRAVDEVESEDDKPEE